MLTVGKDNKGIKATILFGFPEKGSFSHGLNRLNLHQVRVRLSQHSQEEKERRVPLLQLPPTCGLNVRTLTFTTEVQLSRCLLSYCKQKQENLRDAHTAGTRSPPGTQL